VRQGIGLGTGIIGQSTGTGGVVVEQSREGGRLGIHENIGW